MTSSSRVWTRYSMAIGIRSWTICSSSRRQTAGGVPALSIAPNARHCRGPDPRGGISQRVLDHVARGEASSEGARKRLGAACACECPQAAGDRNQARQPRAKNEGLHQFVLHTPFEVARFIESERSQKLPHGRARVVPPSPEIRGFASDSFRLSGDVSGARERGSPQSAMPATTGSIWRTSSGIHCGIWASSHSITRPRKMSYDNRDGVVPTRDPHALQREDRTIAPARAIAENIAQDRSKGLFPARFRGWHNARGRSRTWRDLPRPR